MLDHSQRLLLHSDLAAVAAFGDLLDDDRLDWAALAPSAQRLLAQLRPLLYESTEIQEIEISVTQLKAISLMRRIISDTFDANAERFFTQVALLQASH